MLLLALHIISIGLLILIAGSMGYRAGERRELRRWQRRLERGELPVIQQTPEFPPKQTP